MILNKKRHFLILCSVVVLLGVGLSFKKIRQWFSTNEDSELVQATTLTADSHLTVSDGWGNDLQTITYDTNTGYYNLYFLHSADGAKDVFGEQGQDWYHVQTKDFTHYTSQNSALASKGGDSTDGWKSAWTGSIITNDGTLSQVPQGAEVAYFSGLNRSSGEQDIWAAYSSDNGNTFTHILNNGHPILTADQADNGVDFRDPSVVYWNGKLLMYVAEGDNIGVYQSNNGLDWGKADLNGRSKVLPSTFFAGHSWSGNAPVEVPVLRTMTTRSGQRKTVLFLGAKDASQGQTTGTYYIVGHLDQNGLFVNETNAIRIDDGSDFYGANVSGSDNLAVSNDAIKAMGWIGNWNYTGNGVYDDTTNLIDRLGSYSTVRTLTLSDDLTLKTQYKDLNLSSPKTIDNITIDNPETVDKKKVINKADNGDLRYVLYDIPHQSSNQIYQLTFSTKEEQYNTRIYIDIWQGGDFIKLNYDPRNGYYSVNAKSGELATPDYYNKGLNSEGGYSVQSDSSGWKSNTLMVITDKTLVEFIFPNGKTYTVARFNSSDEQDFKIYTGKEEGAESERLSMSIFQK